jgi:hypothetical protein
MLVIPATQEAEIRRITVEASLGQIISESLSQKYPTQKRADGVAQGGRALPSTLSPCSPKAVVDNK